MPKVYLALRVLQLLQVSYQCSNWSKHVKSKQHLSNESKVERRTDASDDDDFVHAMPTPNAGPSFSPTERSTEVIERLKGPTRRCRKVVSKNASKDKSTGRKQSKSSVTERDKSSSNFLITCH